ncbi:hypothetical protein ACA910_014040 [Epithemia clementina (nom. ined.)]
MGSGGKEITTTSAQQNKPAMERILTSDEPKQQDRRFSYSSPAPSYSWNTFILATIALPFVSIILSIALFVVLLLASPTIWVRSILVLYLFYVALDTTPAHGGWTFVNLQSWMVEHLLRRCALYKALAEYFPVELVKTVDLPATTISADHKNNDDDGAATAAAATKKPYIFAYHPHGVIGVGAVGGLLSNATDFDVKFPGISRRVATLSAVFLVPILRDILLAMGWISVHKPALVKTLRRKESIIMLPGGASEAIMTKPGSFQLYLARRKGFIKLAMEHNVAIVPVLGFGENNAFSLYIPEEGTWTAQMQKLLYKFTSFSLPLMTSPFAQRKPVHVVVGKPVEFDSIETVDECHALYIDTLTEMYNQHKVKYGHEHIPLEIL